MKVSITSLNRLGLVLFSFICFSAGAASADPLFKYKGKTYTDSDLPLKYQMKLHDYAMEHRDFQMSTADETLLDIEYGKAAKKAGKPVLQYVDSLSVIKDPTEAEKKKFYEENKARIPYPYEKVKADLGNFILKRKQAEKRKEVLAKVKKKGGYEFIVPAPQAPKADLKLEKFASRGQKSSKVTIVEFADYKCPHCREAALILDDLYKSYKNKVNFVFVDFPIISPVSVQVAQGAYCAGKQNKYWEFHKMAFDKQGELKAGSSESFAAQLKLDAKKFNSCLNSKEAKQYVDQSKSEGDRVGVSGTPTIFINGVKVAGYQKATVSAALDKALKK